MKAVGGYFELESRNLDRLFTIKSNYEFYCYLKAHLPKEYSIVSEPLKSYYSEWTFHYILYHKERILKEYKGSFLNIKREFLVKKGERILKRIKENQDAYRK